MAVMPQLKSRRRRVAPRARRRNAPPAAGDASLFEDLWPSFLRASGAVRCTITLPSDWRDVIARWMGVAAGEAAGSVEGAAAMPVSWMMLGRGRSGMSIDVDLLLGGASAARVTVVLRKHSPVEAVLTALHALVPQVASRLCLQWLREEAGLLERQRLVHDLHDGPLQIATAAKIRLQSARRAVADPSAGKALDEGIALTAQVVDSLRALLYQRMGPSARLPLETHLRRVAARWAQLTGMRVRVRFPQQAGRRATFSRETVDLAERVVSESIVNAWKHGRATELSVRCRPDESGMTVTVKDDGCGIRALHADQHEGAHLGLRLLRSRVQRAGGRLSVRPHGERGTVVHTWLPSQPTPHREPGTR